MCRRLFWGPRSSGNPVVNPYPAQYPSDDDSCSVDIQNIAAICTTPEREGRVPSRHCTGNIRPNLTQTTVDLSVYNDSLFI